MATLKKNTNVAKAKAEINDVTKSILNDKKNLNKILDLIKNLELPETISKLELAKNNALEPAIFELFETNYLTHMKALQVLASYFDWQIAEQTAWLPV